MTTTLGALHSCPLAVTSPATPLRIRRTTQAAVPIGVADLTIPTMASTDLPSASTMAVIGVADSAIAVSAVAVSVAKFDFLQNKQKEQAAVDGQPSTVLFCRH